jgi:hypothetical protein
MAIAGKIVASTCSMALGMGSMAPYFLLLFLLYSFASIRRQWLAAAS